MLKAIPFSPTPPAKLAHIVTRCCEHRSWFSDYQWGNEEIMRQAVVTYLANAVRVWEVWRDSETPERDDLLGILLINDVNYGHSAQCHFVFFDRELRNKRKLCVSLMQTVFEDPELNLQMLRVEVPAPMGKLVAFLRKALGFRYENEDLLAASSNAIISSTKAAERTSRRRQAFFSEGKWHDVRLLSVSKDEFATFLAYNKNARTKDRETTSSSAGADSTQHGPTTATVRRGREPSAESSADSGVQPTA